MDAPNNFLGFQSHFGIDSNSVWSRVASVCFIFCQLPCIHIKKELGFASLLPSFPNTFEGLTGLIYFPLKNHYKLLHSFLKFLCELCFDKKLLFGSKYHFKHTKIHLQQACCSSTSMLLIQQYMSLIKSSDNIWGFANQRWNFLELRLMKNFSNYSCAGYFTWHTSFSAFLLFALLQILYWN